MSKHHDQSHTPPEGGEAPENKWKRFTEEEAGIELESAVEPAPAVEESGVDAALSTAWEDRLRAKEAEVNEARERMLRIQAEVENVRRRAERDVANAHKFGQERLINDLLPVWDSLSRSLENTSNLESAALEKWVEGVTLTLGLLEKTLQKNGLERIVPARGDVFDPARHEAMSMQPTEGLTSNQIVTVLQPGFVLNGRVLRAAMVIVGA